MQASEKARIMVEKLERECIDLRNVSHPHALTRRVPQESYIYHDPPLRPIF
jgi:hypothetical protein